MGILAQNRSKKSLKILDELYYLLFENWMRQVDTLDFNLVTEV